MSIENNDKNITDQVNPESKAYSITSLVLGIIAVVFLLLPKIVLTVKDLRWIALICAIVGLIHGIAAAVYKTKGHEMAVAGIILCAVSIPLFFIL